MKINWVDIIIMVYIGLSFSMGKKRGIGVEGVAFLTALFAWAVTLHFYQPIGTKLQKTFLLSAKSADTIAMVCLAISVIFLGFLLNNLLKKIMKLSFLPNIEKIGGCIFGVLKSICMAALIVVILVVCPMSFLQNEVYENSFLGNYFVALSPKVHGWIFSNDKSVGASFVLSDFMSELPERPKKEVI